MYAAQEKMSIFAACLRMRAMLLTLPILMLAFVSFLGTISPISAILILVGMQESIVDAHLPLRQILRSSLINTLSVVVRKLLQLTLVVFLYSQGSDLTLDQVILIFAIPSSIVLLSDLIFFSRFRSGLVVGLLKESTKYFFQSFGTNLATIDYFLIGHFGFQNLIYPYALGKKFYSFLMIPGTTYLQTILKLEVRIGNKFSNFWNQIRKVVKITTLFSLLAILLFTVFSGVILGAKLSLGNVLLINLLIMLSILGAVSTNLNAILTGRYLFKRASIATFLSSFIYLVSLYIGFILNLNEYVVLGTALFFNLTTEILLESWLIFRFNTMLPAMLRGNSQRTRASRSDGN